MDKAPWGYCDLCNSPIAIPGLEAYLCSDKNCGTEIIIVKKKKSKVISTTRYPYNGWVCKADIESELEKRERIRKRAEYAAKRKSLKSN